MNYTEMQKRKEKKKAKKKKEKGKKKKGKKPLQLLSTTVHVDESLAHVN